VALGGGSESAAYAPGKIGTTFARQSLQLPQKRVVQISNFIGFALDCTNLVLAEEGRQLPVLWMVGHPVSWPRPSMISGIRIPGRVQWQ